MNLPLYTVICDGKYYDCINSDMVRKILWRLSEKDIFHRPPRGTEVYSFCSWTNVTSHFIKRS